MGEHDVIIAFPAFIGTIKAGNNESRNNQKLKILSVMMLLRLICKSSSW
jgi:hypothetical protein